MKTRKEFDSIGSINVPDNKYWGASTQRSNKFFNIGKIQVDLSIIKSIAIIKRSAAIVHKNDKLGRLNISSKCILERDLEVLNFFKKKNIPVATVIGGGYSADNIELAERHTLIFHAAAQIFISKA